MNFLNIAKKLSFRSNHPKQKMAAVIVRGGAIIAKATNAHHYGAHAEKRALKQNKDAKNSTIYIARSNGLTSKPCPMCLSLISKAGIRKIVFYNDVGQVLKFKV